MLEWIKNEKNYIKYLLFPLATIYRLIVFWRNVLYNHNFFISRKLPAKIISVGNITTGGTGKTPAVIFLTQHFLQKQKKVAILSRGYGRKTAGTQEVTNGKAIHGDWLNFGDEPYLMAKKLPGVPIVVDENRYRGGLYIVEKFRPDIIILDDAFQHRALERDVDIVLINAHDQKSNHKMFPYGLLREPIKNLKRANFIFLSKTNLNKPSPYLVDLTKKIDIPTYYSNFNYSDLISPNGKKPKQNKKLKTLALSGIADTAGFHRMIKQQKHLRIIKTISYSDHYEYSQADMEKIKREVQLNDIDIIVTTEKDMVKIEKLKLSNLEIFSLAGDFQIVEENKFFVQLDKKLLNQS